MKKPLVSIIVVNWNGGEVFRDCLRSLRKIGYENWELIVVDNGSSDGSEKYVGMIDGVVLVSNSDNLGFAQANNQGYRKTKGKYVLLLNNDTKATKGFLKVLVEKMENERDLGVVQPKIELLDKKGYLDNCGSYLTRTGLLQHWGYMEKDGDEYKKEREIFSAKGACMMIRKSVIEKVGLFDEDFGSYFEESDFCWRVWLLGLRVLYYPKTKIYHKVGYASKRMDQVKVTLISTRNRISSLFKNLGMRSMFLIFVPHVLFILALGSYYLLRMQFGKAWMMYGAVLGNMASFPRLVVKRWRVQRLRVKSDREMFGSIMKPVKVREMFGHFRKVEANF